VLSAASIRTSRSLLEQECGCGELRPQRRRVLPIVVV